MTIHLTPEEVKLFEQNGFTKDKIISTGKYYRKKGLSDDEIQSKINDRIAQWKNTTQEAQTQQPVERVKFTEFITNPEKRKQAWQEARQDADLYNEQVKQIGRQKLANRQQWEENHPIISSYQKSFQPNYRADLVDMENQAKYGYRVPIGQHLLGEVKKAGERLIPVANLGIAYATRGKSLPVAGAIGGGVDATLSDIGDGNLSPMTLLHAAGGAGAGYLTGGVMKYGTPLVQRALAPVGRKIKQGIYYISSKAPQIAEFLTSVPAKYGELALKAEEAGKSLFKGKFNPETAYQGVERKLRTAKGSLPTDKQYKEQYKAIGRKAKQKFEKSLVPENVIDDKYYNLGQSTLDKINTYQNQLGENVGTALENLPDDVTFSTKDLINDMDNIYRQPRYSLSGDESLNLARNEAGEIYNNVRELLQGSQAEKQQAFNDVLNNAREGTHYLPDVTRGRYKNQFYTKNWGTEANAIEEAGRRFDNEIINEIKNNPEIVFDDKALEQLEKRMETFNAPEDYMMGLYTKYFNTIADAQTALSNRQTITPKQLYDVNKNVKERTNWNLEKSKAKNNILKQIYGKYANRLSDLSPELAEANKGYSYLMDLEEELKSELKPGNISDVLRDYKTGRQTRTGVNKALENLNNYMPDDLKFLQEAQDLNNLRLGQEQIRKDVGTSVFNDFSRYQNAPFETQNALAKIAPDEISEFQRLFDQQATQKDILRTISGKSYERNPRLLANRNDLAAEEALGYLQENSGINFMDELEQIRAREAFDKWFPGQGGGSGSDQGAANLIRTAIAGGAPAAAIAAHNPAALAGFALISPRLGGKNIIRLGAVGRKVKNLKAPKVDRALLPLAYPTLQPMLQGYIEKNVYNY